MNSIRVFLAQVLSGCPKNKLNLPNQGHSIYSYCLSSVLLCKLFHYIKSYKRTEFLFHFFPGQKNDYTYKHGTGPFLGPRV